MSLLHFVASLYNLRSCSLSQLLLPDAVLPMPGVHVELLVSCDKACQ